MIQFIYTYWLEVILAVSILFCMFYLIANEFASKEIMDSLHRDVSQDDETEHGVDSKK